MGRLDGKVAIITGGNSGVGEVTAVTFAAEGAKVVICARRQAPLDAVAEKIRAAGGEVLAVPTDVTDPEQVKNLVEKAVEAYGTVDVLVNNAGVLEEGVKPIDRSTDEDIEWVINTNTKGSIYCIREVAPIMEKAGKGSIVNVDSVAGLCGCGGVAYVASKGAVLGVTKHTALRYVGKGVRCNSVCPSTIVTPMVMNQDRTKLDADMMSQMAKHADLKIQPCMPQDVADIILFLASDESRAITGQLIVSDYGSTL